jgi:hypothetical protein
MRGLGVESAKPGGSMDPAKRLAQAAGAWLQYEFACNRSELFNERCMSAPIASGLYAIYKQEVRSEFLHPVLGPVKSGPGRRPEVDFAVVKNYPHVSCVLESKWVGANGLSIEEIVWDLLRLELIVYNEKATGFFLMAGRRKHLESLFHSTAFVGKPTSSGKYRRILKMARHRQSRIRVDSPTLDRQKIFQRLLTPYQDVSFPSVITTSVGHRYPEVCPMFQYQAYVWHVFAPTGTPRFYPRNHVGYRAGGNPASDS